jgi:DegV family protein with EDD domain
MAAIHVVTDGTVALPEGTAEAALITIVPQNVIIADRTYRGGVDLTSNELYALLATAPTPPKTSQASPGAFLEAYQRVLAWGVEVVSIHLPRSLSGTADSARNAVALLPRGAPVTVIETEWTSSALGLIALRAAEAGAEGASRADIEALVAELSARMRLYFVVSDLAYLQRGGRIGAGAAWLGSMLKLRPILALQHGAVRPVERVRTTGKALVRLAEIIGESLEPGRAHVGLISGGADAEAAALATFLEGRFHPAELWIAPCDPAVAVHTGPGVFGAAVYSA